MAVLSGEEEGGNVRSVTDTSSSCCIVFVFIVSAMMLSPVVMSWTAREHAEVLGEGTTVPDIASHIP